MHLPCEDAVLHDYIQCTDSDPTACESDQMLCLTSPGCRVNSSLTTIIPIITTHALISAH